MLLHVREAGPLNAPTVLFLHDLGLSSTMWQPQFERLAGSSHCLAPDLPECGHSSAIGPFTLKDAASRVAAVIRERVPGGVAHVVGLSLGGAVALQMLRDEPEGVDHLLISGTAKELPPTLDALHRLDERILRLLSHERLADFLIGPYHVTQVYRPLILADLQQVEPEAIGHFIREMAKLRLPRNGHTPILITAGREEISVLQHAVYEMKRAMPGARGALVPGAGHFWNLEFADLFTQTLRSWIEDEPLPKRLLLI